MRVEPKLGSPGSSPHLHVTLASLTSSKMGPGVWAPSELHRCHGQREKGSRLLWPFGGAGRVGGAEPHRPELGSGLDMERPSGRGAFGTEPQALPHLLALEWVSSHSLGEQPGNIEYHAQPSSLTLGTPSALIHYPSRMLCFVDNPLPLVHGRSVL